MASMNDGYIETAPLVDPNALTNSLRCDGKHSRVVADEDDPPC